MHHLRPYQQDLAAAVRAAWDAGHQRVLMQLATGGGKTVTFTSLVEDWTLVVAHRAEIISQISIALGRAGIPHDVFTSVAVRKQIAAAHMKVFGKLWITPASTVRAASIDTIIQPRRLKQHMGFLNKVRLWIVDESAHVVQENKWGKLIEKLPEDARGLLPTATPVRSDGKGLGSHHDGYADVMVQGPPMKWLIEHGFLSNYRVACVDSHLEEFLGDVATSGDWSQAQLKSASEKSQIAGDVVESYKTHANGKLGITFTTDVDTAGRIARAYRAAGVPAEILTGETNPALRAHTIARFERREILQLVVIDVVSEGFDLPAIEVATFARPTASLGLWLQQAGRVLRPMPGKDYAILIDHVGNFLRHGAPDKHREWTLDRREKRRKKDDDGEIKLRVCLNTLCAHPYPRYLKACPKCGEPVPPPSARGAPEEVEGTLQWMSADVLEKLRGDLDRVGMSAAEYRADQIAKYAPPQAVGVNTNRHKARRAALKDLHQSMAQWASARCEEGLTGPEIERLFFMRFGVSTLEAIALPERDARILQDRVEAG